jgi:hypothetical protein
LVGLCCAWCLGWEKIFPDLGFGWGHGCFQICVVYFVCGGVRSIRGSRGPK